MKETGGHCGGWKEGDHLLYQKIIAKHKLEEAANIINDHLPGKFIIYLKHSVYKNTSCSNMSEKQGLVTLLIFIM